MLVNAFQERGPLFAAVDRSGNGAAIATRAIAPGEEYSWSITTGTNPILQYRPGCEHCMFTDEHEFRAVLAYAYFPSYAPPGMVRCGLRSESVVMPPLTESQAPHNSSGH